MLAAHDEDKLRHLKHHHARLRAVVDVMGDGSPPILLRYVDDVGFLLATFSPDPPGAPACDDPLEVALRHDALNRTERRG